MTLYKFFIIYFYYVPAYIAEIYRHAVVLLRLTVWYYFHSRLSSRFPKTTAITYVIFSLHQTISSFFLFFLYRPSSYDDDDDDADTNLRHNVLSVTSSTASCML